MRLLEAKLGTAALSDASDGFVCNAEYDPLCANPALKMSYRPQSRPMKDVPLPAAYDQDVMLVKREAEVL